jgi:hypothetical protein
MELLSALPWALTQGQERRWYLAEQKCVENAQSTTRRIRARAESISKSMKQELLDMQAILSKVP